VSEYYIDDCLPQISLTQQGKFMIKHLTTILSTIILSGCATFQPVVSPPQLDRLEGLARPEQIKITQIKIVDSSKFKLAIVNSINVQPQIQSYATFSNQFDQIIKAYVTEEKAVKADAAIVLSDKIFLQSIVNSISSRFSETFQANDLAQAFSNGADYVALIDLRFEWVDLSSKVVPGPLSEKNVADISVLFIKNTLESGPDIQIKNTSISNRDPKGPEANIRELLNSIKNTRLKSLKDFDSELNKVVIK
jgi:hypothetical protein